MLFTSYCAKIVPKGFKGKNYFNYFPYTLGQVGDYTLACYNYLD